MGEGERSEDSDHDVGRGSKGERGAVDGPLGWLAGYFEKEFVDSRVKVFRWMRGEKMEAEEELEAAARRSRLDFLPENNDRFRPDEEVEFRVAVQNVSSLLLRVFEVNTENYYLEKGEPFRADLNLEGLVPAQERVFSFE